MRKHWKPLLAVSMMLFVVALSIFYPYSREQALASAEIARQTRVEEYAEVLASAVHTKEGDRVVISADATQADFAATIAEKCYEQGAMGVEIIYNDANMMNLQAKYLRDTAYDGYYYKYAISSYINNTMAGAKSIYLAAHNFDDNKPTQQELASFRETVQSKINSFMEEHKIAVPNDNTSIRAEDLWVVAPYPTKSWAQKVYPKLSALAAYNAMLDDFLDFARIGKNETLSQHAEALDELAQRANKLEIVELHYKSKTADLRVPLHENNMFVGGSATTSGGEIYYPNIPTEEIFTMPHKYGATGTVKATRPLVLRGQLVEDLTMTFRDGKLIDFSASSGNETFQSLLDSSPDGVYLGEAALVSSDSPILKSGKVYYETILDENAGAHIALGFAYKIYNLKPGMVADENVNDANYHVDITIGSEDLTVTATLKDGSEIDVIKKGAWNI